MKRLKVIMITMGLILYLGMHVNAMQITQENRDDYLRKDLHFLASYLEECHPNLFFKIKPETYHSEVWKLDRDIPNLSDNKIMVRMMQLTAMCGDAHTTMSGDVAMNYRSVIQKKNPFLLEWISDGVYITNTNEEYRDLIGCKIIRWNKLPIEKVMEKVATLTAQENLTQTHVDVAYFLMFPDIVSGLGLAEDSSCLELEVEDDKGIKSSRSVSAFPLRMFEDKDFWVRNNTNQKLPLYRTNSGQNYWFTYLKNEKVLYFKYNTCVEMVGKTFDSIRTAILQTIDNEDVDKVVIDLRDNRGGSAWIFYPMIQEIKDREKVNQKGHLFVIIGKYTFSAGVMNAVQLKAQTNAILIGNATRGKPNFYSDHVPLVLPHSGLIVRCSTYYVHTAERDVASLVPDVVVDFTAQDYFGNRDPFLNYVLHYRENL